MSVSAKPSSLSMTLLWLDQFSTTLTVPVSIPYQNYNYKSAHHLKKQQKSRSLEDR